jgi:hypothetical protein
VKPLTPLGPPDDWSDLAELFPAPPADCRLSPPTTGVLPPGLCAGDAAGGLRLTDPVERLARLFAELDE